MPSTLYVLFYYLMYSKPISKKSFDTVKFWQEKKIKKHLTYICKHIPFYESYVAKPLSSFPLMDKQAFMNHFSELNAYNITEDEAISFAIKAEKNRDFQEKLGAISVGLSSGTSGRRGAFLVSDMEGYMWAGYVLRHFLPKGILHTCRIAFFMRANNNLYEAVGSNRIQFVFYDILKDVSEHIESLCNQNPDVLVGQPSLLLALATYKQEGKLSIHPTTIISVAEVLEDHDAAFIKSVFKVLILHQAYQCTEGCLALTCKCGNLHINEDIVHIEKEYLDDSRFIPIVTDFTRKTQPIIRYRLNDILQENKEPCPCGSHFTRIQKIEGREDDIFHFIVKNSDEVIQVYPDFIRRCMLFSHHQYEYRIVQQANLDIYIYTTIKDDQTMKITKEFLSLANEKNFVLPNLHFFPYNVVKGKKMKRIERLS